MRKGRAGKRALHFSHSNRQGGWTMNTNTIAPCGLASPQSLDAIDPEIEGGLRLAEQELRKHTDDLVSEWDKPLEVNAHGYIVQGVAWLNGPFATDFWSSRRKQPKPKKCLCPSCGRKHTLKG
jgi:hypothetical protein